MGSDPTVSRKIYLFTLIQSKNPLRGQSLLSATHKAHMMVVGTIKVVVVAIEEIDNPRISTMASIGRGRPICN